MKKKDFSKKFTMQASLDRNCIIRLILLCNLLLIPNTNAAKYFARKRRDSNVNDEPGKALTSNHQDDLPLFNGSLYHPGIYGVEKSADEFYNHQSSDSLSPIMDYSLYPTVEKAKPASDSSFDCLVRPWYPQNLYNENRRSYGHKANLTIEFPDKMNASNRPDWLLLPEDFDREYTDSGLGMTNYPPRLDKASPQSGMEACEMFEGNSCCTAEQADELMLPIRSHSGIRWDLCGPPRRDCNQVMAELECFYECSPFISSWFIGLKDSITLGNYLELADKEMINGVPLCANFCDLWYNSCKNEKTCAKQGNWLTGHKFVMNESRCLDGSRCLNFKELYSGPHNLCNNLWGKRYKYELDPDKCFDPRKVHDHAKVWKLLKNTASSSNNYKCFAPIAANFWICTIVSILIYVCILNI